MFHAQTPDDQILTYKSGGSGSGIVPVASGEAPLDEEVVKNGGFEDGMRNWQLKPGDVARVSIAKPGHESRKAAKIVGTGSAGTLVTFSQTSQLNAPPGACFRYSVWTRGSKLSRPLVVWASLIHPDGSASPQLAAGSRRQGVGPGSSPWRRSVDTGVLKDAIVGMTIFAADTGQVPITGTAWVDNLSLRRTC